MSPHLMSITPIDFKKQFRTDVVLAEKGTVEQFSDKLRMIFLQLPLFKKEADEWENQVERWIFVCQGCRFQHNEADFVSFYLYVSLSLHFLPVAYLRFSRRKFASTWM